MTDKEKIKRFDDLCDACKTLKGVSLDINTTEDLLELLLPKERSVRAN